MICISSYTICLEFSSSCLSVFFSSSASSYPPQPSHRFFHSVFLLRFSRTTTRLVVVVVLLLLYYSFCTACAPARGLVFEIVATTSALQTYKLAAKFRTFAVFF
eukprot:GHVS01101372.1.p1 GENE.GHVS01101372.1~~GHVS01101372.1.p1  ORF type:complete len:104 (+),score=16.26 GHVS01101372.1:98-409(+)